LILKKTAGGKIGENPIGLRVLALKGFWMTSTERHHGGFLIAAGEQTAFDR
jgi:hypothetical protein